MPSKKVPLVNNEIYHIFNRAIEGKDIFQNDSDRFRFVFSLYEMNDKNAVNMRDRRLRKKLFEELPEVEPREVSLGSTSGNLRYFKREKLVEILVFTLMPNHYHLIVRQLVDNGISLFMKKLSNGYTGYFNEKYDRKGRGSLFQSRFKAVYVATNEQFLNLVCYIFTNPLELLDKEWKEKGAEDFKKARNFLENKYKWSSYFDCIGKKNFPSVTERDFLIKVFESPEKLKESVRNWILYKLETRDNFEKIKDLILE